MAPPDTRIEAFSSRWIPTTLRAVPPLVLDAALAVVLAAALVRDLARQELPPGGPLRSADALGYVLVTLLVLPLAVRRRFPVTVFALILIDAVVTVVIFYRPTSFGFGLILATYSVARWRTPVVSFVAFGAAQAFGIFIKIRARRAGFEIPSFEWLLDATYFGSAWFLGLSLRSRQQYAAALESSREALAQRAVQDERTRIARELHDAVGHSISVMTLHIGAAEELCDRQPARAKEALASAGDVGRAAMSEMDQLLGLLRSDDPEPPELLQPSLVNLEALVDEFRHLGLSVETTVVDVPPGLPRPVDQSAFRIVQEALTNSLKHAGRTDVSVRVACDDRCLTVEVRDGGRRGGHRYQPAAGHRSQGLIGMQERVALLKGDLEVGPNGDRGFRVAARLPLENRRAK